MNRKCSNCGSNMIEKGTRMVSGDEYHILYCEQCKRQVARM